MGLGVEGLGFRVGSFHDWVTTKVNTIVTPTERQRERERDTHMYIKVYIYIYLFIYLYIHTRSCRGFQ